MKRISFFLALTLIIFSFGLANAEQSIRLIEVDGFWSEGGTTYINPSPSGVSWDVRVVNQTGTGCAYLFATPFELYSPDGASWTSFEQDTLNIASQTGGQNWVPELFTEVWVWGIWPNTTPADGTSPDTTAYLFYWGGSGLHKDVLYDGFDVTGIRMSTGAIAQADTNKTMCLNFLGANAPLGWEGTWASFDQENCAAVNPAYLNDATGDPYPSEGACYTIKKMPDQPPCPTGPTNLAGSHCELMTADYEAHDPDGSDAITFSLVDGPAGATLTQTDATHAHFEWMPSLADVGTSISFKVHAEESDGTACELTVNAVPENVAPVMPATVCKPYPAQVGVEFTTAFTSTDVCSGDPRIYSIVDDGGVPNSLFEFQGNVLHLLATDEGVFVVTVQVSDGVDASECNITLNISKGAPFQFEIEKTENTPQGQFVGVDVTVLNNIEDDFGGFNFLIAYDASALTFQGADVDNAPLFGTDQGECAWEYFTYRFGPDGNCGSGCPSGLLRVVGIAETNNGPYHPSCWSMSTDPDGYTLFTMNFLVSNDRTLECSYVPIRFYWIECGDNTVSNKDGDLLFISARVMDYAFDPNTDYLQEIQDSLVGFPTYQGAQDECFVSDKDTVQSAIDFINGGVDIVCGKDVDDRGDVNLDGLAYTIADAVMFTNYFIEGLSAFGAHQVGSIAATDINADGIALSVADLVYLIRVIVGDAQPYATGFLKPATVNSVYHINNGVVNVEEAMGAAVLHIAGDVAPALLADNMEMKYAYDAEKNITSAVVYSLKNNNFVGDFIDARGDIIDIEMATAKGNPVNGTLVPSNFALFQNYPNPFNPTTTISFALSQASDYSLTIYNVTGQVVATFNGHSEAGNVNVEWDATSNASGVYFYKLDAGTFSATKKMVLLK